jgi:hypothetical protein
MALKVDRSSYSLILEKEFLLDNSTTYYVNQAVVFGAGGVVVPAPAGATNILGVIVGFTGKDGRVVGQGIGDSVTTLADNTTTKTYWAKVAMLNSDVTLEADFTGSIATHNVGDSYSLAAGGRLVDASSRVQPGGPGYPKEVVLVEKVSDTVGKVKIRSRLF